MNALLTTAGTLAGKELFKKIVIETYQLVIKKTGRKLKEWGTHREIEKLYGKIGQVRRVKTIWQIDKAVDLLDFYCDSHVILNEKRSKVTQLSDFGPLKDNILIQGIAGQGKSILLRYLCSVELGRGEYIPIFLELRRVSPSESLKKRIFTAFESLGLSVDDEIFEALATSGKLVLLLDAFDEVPDDLKSRVLTEIEDLITTRPKIRVIVTSRPHQDVRVSNYLNVVTLDNLQGDEYKKVIKKLASGQAWADTLIDHIENQARHIIDLLCTPLMVTLLVLSYKSYKELPAKLSDFYDSLFQTLLQRHDGTKPGFRRLRGCALDDGQYRQAFEALCILAKKTRQQSFSTEAIYSFAQQALQQCSLKANSSYYIDDIVKITCLVLRDGEEHRFIHKTVQEYYTASYIQKRPEPWAINFYERVLKTHSYHSWQQELEFLSEIDLYRYNKYFLLPAILDLLSLTYYDLKIPYEDVRLPDISNLLSKLFVTVIYNKKTKSYNINAFFSNINSFINRTIYLGSPSQFIEYMMKAFKRAGDGVRELTDYKDYAFFKQHNLFNPIGESIFCVGDIVKMGVAPEISSTISRNLEIIFKQACEMWKNTKQEENPSLLEGLL